VLCANGACLTRTWLWNAVPSDGGGAPGVDPEDGGGVARRRQGRPSGTAATLLCYDHDSVNVKSMPLYHGYNVWSECCCFWDRSRMLFPWCAGRLQMRVSARCALGILGEPFAFFLCVLYCIAWNH
jgi:hypothetical protein